MTQIAEHRYFTPLLTYVLAATLGRAATGGATVAIILLASEMGATAKLAGALAACLTAPHLAGPVFGRLLDKTSDVRRLIAGAALIFALCFQLAILDISWQNTSSVIMLLLACGTCSSLLMGGLSTQLTRLVGPDKSVRRRAQSWDAMTYGIGTTFGPLLIALISSHYSIQAAITVLMGLPVLSAVLILCFPASLKKSTEHIEATPDVRSIINMFSGSAPLKRTLLMTSCGAFAIASLPVIAVYLSDSWQQGKENGAFLVTLYGVGGLLGALGLTIKPMKAEAQILIRRIGIVLCLTLLLVALSPSFSLGLLTYAACGVVNAALFTATLAARSDYAPEHGAAQVFMWVAAAKIGAASLGALSAGFLVALSVTAPLFGAAAVLAMGLLLSFGRYWSR